MNFCPLILSVQALLRPFDSINHPGGGGACITRYVFIYKKQCINATYGRCLQ